MSAASAVAAVCGAASASAVLGTCDAASWSCSRARWCSRSRTASCRSSDSMSRSSSSTSSSCPVPTVCRHRTGSSSRCMAIESSSGCVAAKRRRRSRTMGWAPRWVGLSSSPTTRPSGAGSSAKYAVNTCSALWSVSSRCTAASHASTSCQPRTGAMVEHVPTRPPHLSATRGVGFASRHDRGA